MLGSGERKETRYAISPDGRTVMCRADQDTHDVFELYRVPILGDESRKLNDSLVAGGVISNDFIISADGRLVVYLADQDIDQEVGLFERWFLR